MQQISFHIPHAARDPQALTVEIDGQFNRNIVAAAGNGIVNIMNSSSSAVWKDFVAPRIGAEWSKAAVEHFGAHEPKAYQRTGALTIPEIATGFSIDRVKIESLSLLVLPVKLFLDESKVVSAHKLVQQSLEDLDVKRPNSKHKDFAYKVMWKEDGEPLYYPYHANPDYDQISLGVKGSWHEQTYPYLFDYLLVGPNAPDQPLIYRKLGGSGRRDKERGLDLLNRFFDHIGLEPVAAPPDPVTKYIQAEIKPDTMFKRGTPLTRFAKEMGAQINRSVVIELDVFEDHSGRI